MNYRHIFHAGNSSEVVKHNILLLLFDALQQKEKGFCFIDTHAGCGLYDLTSVQANKTLEYKEGIQLLTGKYSNTILKQYLQLVKSIGENYYPGSPWFARSLLRDQDRMILNELHPDDYQELKSLFHHDAQVAVHHRDAYEFLPAVIPPEPKRGLVLIDPPFEDFDEKQHLIKLIEKCYKKWPQAVYMIWLPLKEESLQPFYQDLSKIPFKNNFTLEFYWKSAIVKSNALLGCSIVILNLPFSAQQSLKILLTDLKTALKMIDADFDCSFIEN